MKHWKEYCNFKNFLNLNPNNKKYYLDIFNTLLFEIVLSSYTIVKLYISEFRGKKSSNLILFCREA